MKRNLEKEVEKMEEKFEALTRHLNVDVVAEEDKDGFWNCIVKKYSKRNRWNRF